MINVLEVSTVLAHFALSLFFPIIHKLVTRSTSFKMLLSLMWRKPSAPAISPPIKNVEVRDTGSTPSPLPSTHQSATDNLSQIALTTNLVLNPSASLVTTTLPTITETSGDDDGRTPTPDSNSDSEADEAPEKRDTRDVIRSVRFSSITVSVCLLEQLQGEPEEHNVLNSECSISSLDQQVPCPQSSLRMSRVHRPGHHHLQSSVRNHQSRTLSSHTDTGSVTWKRCRKATQVAAGRMRGRNHTVGTV